MGEPVMVEILGHKATVKWIKGQKPSLLLRNDYGLSVWVDFEKAVDEIFRFGFVIPVKNYGKEELRETIEREGEKTLLQMQDNNRKLQAQREQEQATIKELDEKGSNLLNMLSG